MALICSCLRRDVLPSTILSTEPQQQDEWQTVADIDTKTKEKILPPYFRDDFPLPPYLAGIKILEELTQSLLMADCVFMMRHGVGVDVDLARQELHKCQGWWRLATQIWQRGSIAEGEKFGNTMMERWFGEMKQAWGGDSKLHQKWERLMELRADYVVAVMFYTSEAGYAALNTALRSRDVGQVMYFLPYLAMLLKVGQSVVCFFVQIFV